MPSTMFIQQNKSKRLTLDKIGQLEEDLEAEPLNYTKWNKLIDQVIAKDNQEQVRAVYTKYLNIFKFDGSNWCKYIRYELNRGEKQKVESLFQQCFAITDSVELCRLYVDYVRSATDFITGGEQARGTVIQAFEFAIGKVGIDVNSDSLWNDYIAFLKSWTPNANWEQQQKTDLIRKVYKKYLIIPTENIETSWSQYTKWENELNPATAQKFISEKSGEFMLARSWHTEWNNLIGNKKLKRTISPYSIIGEEHELIETQLNLWLKWIEFEKKNTLEIKDESLIEKRISYVYKQSTYALPFVGQLWFTYCKYLLFNNEEANLGACIALLKDGSSLNPKSMLLCFQLAELYEKDDSFDQSKEVFNNLINSLLDEFNGVKTQINELNDRIKQKQQQQQEDQDEQEDNETITKSLTISIGDSKQLLKLQEIHQRLSNSITLAYIKLMIASKRARDIKEARNVFKTARKFESIGYEIFIESALLEHYTGNSKTALKIFDLGKKSFSTNGKFLLAYLDYLIMINDAEAMRSTLQTSDTSISKEISIISESLTLENLDPITKQRKEKELNIKKGYLRKLYKKYISFAADYLQMDVINSFVKKYEQLLPEDDPIDLFTDRYKLGQANIIKRTEIGGIDESDDEEDEHPSKRRRVTKKALQEEVNNVVQNIQESSSHVTEPEQKQQDIFVGPSIIALMGALPNASYFGLPSESVFDSEKLVTLFANLSNIPQ
ncbi:mRNA 3'-end-processing protein RNA14 [Spathaspora sp. JA1]|nr:mRNA 3'-end-processing protein RNA14 [Spathaspora sp. JA1]